MDPAPISRQLALPATDLSGAYQACDPLYPIPFEDRAALYADLAPGRGGARLTPIERAINRSDSHSFHLVAGHNGCGKSTELLQLAHRIGHGPDAFTVVRIDALSEVNLQDLEFPDVLLAIFNATASRLGAVTQARQAATTFYRDVLSLLGTPIESGEVDAGITSLRLSLTQNAADRAALRSKANRSLSGLIDRMNQLADGVQRAGKAGAGGLVLILDNFEKMSPRETAPGSGRTNVEQLYLEQAPLLRQLRAHVILTVPVSLALVSGGSQLGALYGSDPVILPMINLDLPLGRTAMLDLLRKRVDFGALCGVEGEACLKIVVDNSGGCPRDAVRIVREATSRYDDPPMHASGFEDTIREMTTMFERAMPPGWPSILARIQREHDFPVDTPLDVRRDMLRDLYVLEYRNGEPNPSYGVHPLVRRTAKFKTAAAAAAVTPSPAK